MDEATALAAGHRPCAECRRASKLHIERRRLNVSDRPDNALSTSSRESLFGLQPSLAFSIFAAISLAVWWRALASSFSLALRDDQYTHILLILPISVALIFVDWKSPEPTSRLGAGVGSGLMAASALVTIIARWGSTSLQSDEQLSMNMLALVVWWIGAFILCFGTRAFRRAVFPLCFLFWIVPIPQFALGNGPHSVKCSRFTTDVLTSVAMECI